MRLCAVLALLLVASVVLAVEVMRRPRRQAAVASPPDVAEMLAPPQQAPRRAPSRPPLPASPRVPRPPAPATISGHLRAPDNADLIVVTVRRNGGTEAEASGFDHDGGFQIDGLVAGRRYDVEFSGPQVRPLTLIGVVAPAADLDVALEARAVIHVAVGFPRGEGCPIDKLLLGYIDGGSPWVKGIPVDREDCRFEISAPAGRGPITVTAEGGAAFFAAEITIPDHGDPEPICLNPPCRANPLEGQAHLTVTLAGVESHSPIRATIVPVGDADTRYGCGSSLFTCTLDALPAGRTYAITASGDDCHGGPVIAAIGEGENAVSVPCVRDPPEDESPPDPPDDLDS